MEQVAHCAGPAGRHVQGGVRVSEPDQARSVSQGISVRSHPLRRFAPSPSLAAREGDDTVGAGRPFLGVPGICAAPVAGAVTG
ncbi:hypothetical protein EAG14_21010 [Acidovorax sp. 1608163]|nr:hypothetical protein EAG14_21010 [Acidovorax sp. 1608163]